MKLMTFGELRQANLPPEGPDDSDALRSLRKTCSSAFPDSAKVAVSRAVRQLAEELNKQPDEPLDEEYAED